MTYEFQVWKDGDIDLIITPENVRANQEETEKALLRLLAESVTPTRIYNTPTSGKEKLILRWPKRAR